MTIHTISHLRRALTLAIGARKSMHILVAMCFIVLLCSLVTWAGWSYFAATPVDAASHKSLKLNLSTLRLRPVASITTARKSTNDGEAIAAPEVTPEPSPIPFGNAETDFPNLADFDGDGKVDIAYYTSTTSTLSYIRSIDGIVQNVQFGQSGDISNITGDYDGDGKADPAVFRCVTVGQPCLFLYKSSSTGNTVTVPWGGVGVDQSGGNIEYVPYPGDFDGDGKYDFCVYRLNTTTGLWEFLLLRSSDSQTETITLGNFTSDYLVPGDYDGDGKSDFMLGRTGASAATPIQWTLLTRTGAGPAAPVTFGRSDDIPTPADYDGDGKTDIAVRRRSDTTFDILRSSDTTTWVVTIGQTGDFPAATWNVR